MAFANHPADQPPNRDIDHAGLQRPRETLYPLSLSIRVVAFSRGQIRSPFNAAYQICKRLFRERRLQRLGSTGLSSTLFNTHFGARRYFPRFFNESCRHRFSIKSKFRFDKQISQPRSNLRGMDSGCGSHRGVERRGTSGRGQAPLAL